MENKYISLNNLFALRASDSQKVLHGLEKGDVYELTMDQYEFLLLLNGSIRLKELINRYDASSSKIIDNFIKNLSAIGALAFSEKRILKTIHRKTVPDRRLESVHLEASARCNMNCVHCYQAKFKAMGAELEFEEIISLLDQMSEMQVSNIGISGGEPLMMPYLSAIMKNIEKRNIRISALFTNGLLVNKDVIEMVKSMQSKFGIFVSLDSISGEGMIFRGYNQREGKIVLKKILRNIRELISSGLKVVLNTVVNSANIDNLGEMYSLVRDLEIDSWRIGFPKPTSNFKKHLDKFGIDWEIVAEKCLVLLKRHFRDNMPFHLQIEYLFREELFEDGFLTPLSDEDYVCDYEGRRSECCVKPNGDIVSCAYCSDLPIGNIKQSPLWDIWYSSKMKAAKMLKIGDVAECKNCELKPLCGTGCRANAFFLHSDFWNAKDDYACKAVKFFSQKVLPLLKTYNFL